MSALRLHQWGVRVFYGAVGAASGAVFGLSWWGIVTVGTAGLLGMIVAGIMAAYRQIRADTTRAAKIAGLVELARAHRDQCTDPECIFQTNRALSDIEQIARRNRRG